MSLGVGRVLVIEAARLAAAASGGAAGALAPERHQLSDPAAFMALARASPALYRQLDHDWDRALGLQWTPGLLLLPEGPPAGGPWPGVELLNSDQVAELVPELVPMPAGLLAHDQAWVHPSRLAAARFRPATGDGQPVIDRVPGLDNAWVSAGHDGTGLLMAPATGQALATWITTSRHPKRSPASASPDSPGGNPDRGGHPALLGRQGFESPASCQNRSSQAILASSGNDGGSGGHSSVA